MGYYPRGATSVSDDDDDGDQKVALWAPVAEVLVPAGGDTAYVDFEVRGKTLISLWKTLIPHRALGVRRAARREGTETRFKTSQTRRASTETQLQKSKRDAHVVVRGVRAK